MRNASVSAILSCTPEAFWVAFVSASYVKALYLGELGCQELGLVELGEVSRKLLITPTLKLPPPIAKRVGPRFAYEEHAIVRREAGECTWRLLPPVNFESTGERFDGAVAVRGRILVQPETAGRCRRVDEFEIEARVFGVGALIESTIEKELLAARAKESAFVGRWLVRRG